MKKLNTEKISAVSEPGCASEVRVWDSRNFDSRDAFDYFREEVCKLGLVWNPHTANLKECQWGFELRSLENGVVCRSHSQALNMQRRPREIDKSELECFSGFWNLSGTVAMTRGEQIVVVRPGDLVFCDMSYPINMQTHAEHQALGFILPKQLIPEGDKKRNVFRDLVISRESMSVALRSSLDLLSDRLLINGEESNAVYGAFLNLLSVESKCYGSEEIPLRGKDTKLFRDVLAYVDRQLQEDPTAAKVAAAYGISERHVFRIFADHGLKFGSYLQKRRLQMAAGELMSRTYVSITDIALKWGFPEVSSFSRTFRKYYNCSPSHFRKGRDE